MPLIKVCGLKRPEDAEMAIEAGANALGLVFAEGPRQASREDAKRIIEIARGRARVIGVFVDQTAFARQFALDLGLDGVQLHGRESAAEIRELASACPGVKVFKALDPRASDQIADHEVLPELEALILDPPRDRREPFSEAMLRARPRARFVIAGGLDAASAPDLIRSLRPYGVDASSRLESEPGKKDPKRVREFVRAVRLAFAEIGELS